VTNPTNTITYKYFYPITLLVHELFGFCFFYRTFYH